MPGATKNPAPIMGPPVTCTVQSRRRSSTGSAIFACRRSTVLAPLQGYRERRLTLATDPQGGQLARLQREPELQFDRCPRRLGRLELLDHDRADLSYHVQRLIQVEVPQPDAGHAVTGFRRSDLHPDRRTAWEQ